MQTCNNCGKQFKDKRGLRGHLMFVHDIQDQDIIEQHYDEKSPAKGPGRDPEKRTGPGKPDQGNEGSDWKKLGALGLIALGIIQAISGK